MTRSDSLWLALTSALSALLVVSVLSALDPALRPLSPLALRSLSADFLVAVLTFGHGAILVATAVRYFPRFASLDSTPPSFLVYRSDAGLVSVSGESLSLSPNPTPRESLTYATARASQYAAAGDFVLARAMQACATVNARRIASATTDPVGVTIPLDSTDRADLW